MSPRPLRAFPEAPAEKHDAIERADGSRLALRRYPAPASALANAPLVLHLHGGAFAGGSLDSGAPLATLLAEAGAHVVSLDYPLAPAHPFPAAVEAGYEALQWLDRNRRRLAGARAPLWVAGEEAGGNLAAAVAMVARDRDGPALDAQLLLSPMLDPCIATASQRQAGAGAAGCRVADGWCAYLARCDDALHPYAVPGRSMRLTGLPRTLLVSATDDPLRDETQAYHHRLRAAGVEAVLAVLDEPTGWPLSFPQAATAAWRPALAEHVRDFVSTTVHQ